MDKFFSNSESFLKWMQSHYHLNEGLWITFDKTKKTSSLTAAEALDIALCYGWIDGKIKRVDEHYYVKYFHKRLKNSIWSTKNKNRVLALIKEGHMQPAGLEAIHLAMADGRWEKADNPHDDYDLEAFSMLIEQDELAYNHFTRMSPSVQKTYALSYYALKNKDSRSKRLSVIIERLRANLKPMD